MEREDREIEALIRRRYREVEVAVREGTMLIGGDGLVVASWKAQQRLGLADGDVVGGPPLPEGWALVDDHGDALDATEHPVAVALATGEVAERRVGYVRPDGTTIPLRLVAHPVVDDPTVAVDLVLSDGERRARGRSAIEHDETRFRTLSDMLPVAVYEASPSGEVTYVNPKFTELTGYVLGDAPDLPLLEIVHPDDVVDVMDVATRGSATDGFYRSRYRVRHQDGSSRWVISRLTLRIGDDGRMDGYIGTIEDVDDLHRAERDAKRLADIVEAASDAVAVFEADELVYLNESATALLERTDPAFGVGPRSHVFAGPLLDRFQRDIQPALVATGRWTGEVRLHDALGLAVDLALDVTAEVHDGVVGRTVLIARDIEDQIRREATLRHDANHDPLTGLANRHLLSERIGSVSSDAPEVAVLYVDIDHFKRINDRHGHATGDAVLIAVAGRLSRVVRAGDVVARVGGDEIVVWAPTSSSVEARALADRLIAAVNGEPVAANGLELAVTITIGLACGSAAEGEAALIGRADRALYRAKRTGRNRWATATSAD